MKKKKESKSGFELQKHYYPWFLKAHANHLLFTAFLFNKRYFSRRCGLAVQFAAYDANANSCPVYSLFHWIKVIKNVKTKPMQKKGKHLSFLKLL